MIDVFSFHEGTSPLLISVPHDGIHLPAEIREQMTAAGAALPDTDWHVAELYAFARELGASMLVANYSRYVVDLNRPASDAALYPGQVATGLCPLQTFDGDDIYVASGPDDSEMAGRVAGFWQPYHDKIESAVGALRERHGCALLWDAHSIAARVAAVAAASPYSNVVNGRFQGGFITRQYGDPEQDIHAIQLEISQRTYMDETTTVFDARKAAVLRGTLRPMLEAFLESA